jgi:hypothetical protein
MEVFINGILLTARGHWREKAMKKLECFSRFERFMVLISL